MKWTKRSQKATHHALISRNARTDEGEKNHICQERFTKLILRLWQIHKWSKYGESSQEWLEYQYYSEFIDISSRRSQRSPEQQINLFSPQSEFVRDWTKTSRFISPSTALQKKNHIPAVKRGGSMMIRGRICFFRTGTSVCDVKSKHSWVKQQDGDPKHCREIQIDLNWVTIFKDPPVRLN